jgi:hypothetical protein
MKCRLLTLVVFLALPSVSAAPPTFVGTCNVQTRTRDGRDAEGLVIPGQSAELVVPCITKDELARIIEDYNKGDIEKMDQALDTLRRAKQIKVMLTPDTNTREKD